MASIALAILFVALVREHEPVLNSTASFQDVRVFGVFVAFADDVCRAELELVGKGGSTRPLYVFRVVVGSRVLAAHHIDIVETFGVAANARELWRFSIDATIQADAERTWGMASTRRWEVSSPFRSVRLWILESLTLSERRACAPHALSSAAYRRLRIRMAWVEGRVFADVDKCRLFKPTRWQFA